MSTSPKGFHHGLTQENEDEIENLEIEIVRLVDRIQHLGPHRSYSLAITKLDEARHWLRDRKRRHPNRDISDESRQKK